MQLHLQTWQEIESYLETSRGLIIPIGSTEQHGPNGLLGTDIICPEVIAEQAGNRGDILVAPSFNVGCAQHHMAFPGSITLRPSTMIAAMTDWVNSLACHGFTHFYFLNGHGGNVATIQAAFSEIHAQRSLKSGSGAPEGLQLMCQNWWQLKGVFDLCKKLYPEGHGAHATPSEVSVTYYAYPDAVKQADMSPKIAPMGPIRDAEDYRRRFPDGRMGSDPSQANVGDGETLVTLAVSSLIDDYQAFLESA